MYKTNCKNCTNKLVCPLWIDQNPISDKIWIFSSIIVIDNDNTKISRKFICAEKFGKIVKTSDNDGHSGCYTYADFLDYLSVGIKNGNIFNVIEE